MYVVFIFRDFLTLHSQKYIYVITAPLYLTNDFVFIYGIYRSSYLAFYPAFLVILLGAVRKIYLFPCSGSWLSFLGSIISGIESDDVSDISVVEV